MDREGYKRFGRNLMVPKLIKDIYDKGVRLPHNPRKCWFKFQNVRGHLNLKNMCSKIYQLNIDIHYFHSYFCNKERILIYERHPLSDHVVSLYFQVILTGM